MRKIEVDTKVAEETRTVVMKKEQEAQKQKDESSAIAADAQKDLDEAMPALEAALASLKSLNKNDVVEVSCIAYLLQVVMEINNISLMKIFPALLASTILFVNCTY